MMNLAPSLVRLRLPLIAGALAAAGAALMLWSQAERDNADASLRQHTTRLTQARAMHQAARETDTAARAGLRQIEALRGQGLLDTPDRRAWQAHLLGLQGKLQLDALEWELGPFAHAASRDDAPSTAQASALRRSTLHLKGEIAHEGQLLALLERPPGSASAGLFLPRRCRLAPSPPTEATDAQALAIDCEIDWLFLQLPATP
ncbi:MAG: hypothetical protein PHW25_09605 [Zoogloea sp.]|jgi:hypothetical protein|uniref:hypothetical protein n=1 Tax=Zoogloea sp. TaxID=49181 RepID=UPI002606CBDE|nr:hypothetical protein [Zoogloea sp.]MDD3327324.1 hypothetical protein [Zoogloea sp.]